MVEITDKVVRQSLNRALASFSTDHREDIIKALGVASFVGPFGSILTNTYSPSGFVLVASKEDFPLPPPGSNVITLEDGYTYMVTREIDLEGCRLVAGRNTVLLGTSSENSGLKSTGLGAEPLISSNWSLPMRFLKIEGAQIALDLDASSNPDQVLDWIGVNFLNCVSIGTIKTYTNFILQDGAFLNSGGLVFDGTFDTVGFTQCLISVRAGTTGITFPSTSTINRRFRMIYSAIRVIDPSATGINVSTSATFPVEGYILDTLNFSGAGTYITGVPFSDTKALFVNNRGISNSARVAYYTMTGNATGTTIGSSTVPVKVLGTTTNGSITQKFSHTDNRATYTGALPRVFSVSATASSGSTNNNVISFYIAKNGTAIAESKASTTVNANGRGENSKCQAVVSLSSNDYIEVWVANDTTTNTVTVSDLNVIIQEIP